MIITVSLIDALPFLEKLETNQKTTTLTDTLVFSEGFTFDVPNIVVFSDLLVFNEAVAVEGTTFEVNLSDTLFFSESIGRVFDVSISDNLSFTDSISRIHGAFTDTLAFSETFHYDSGIAVSDVLSFTETLAQSHIYYTPIYLSDTLEFRDTLIVYYIPIVGRPWDVNTNYITINRQHYTVLGTISIRNPIFGNQDKITYNIISKTSMDGTLILCGNSMYPYVPFIESLSYTIDNLKQIDGYNLINLLQSTLGTPINVTDYEGVSYTGLITTPELSLVQKDRTNYSVTFDFEIIP